MKKILFLFGVLLSIAACKDSEVEKYLANVNSLNTSLDSAETVFQNNKIDSTGRIIRTVRDKILIVKRFYQGGDTINKEVGNLVDSYKTIRKALANNGKVKSKLESAIPQVREDLSNLKHDIENGVGEREKYPNYIQNETNKINQINSLLNEYVQTQNKYLQRFDSLHPLMVEFTEKMLPK